MGDEVVQAFQDECRVAIGKGRIAGQQTNVGDNTWSQYFALIPHGAPNVLGAFTIFAIAYTAGAAQNAVANQTVGPTTTPTDLLDGAFDQVQICPAPNTEPRSYITTRLAAEEIERITLDIRGYSYPRAVPANFAGAGTRTDTAVLFTPVGGQGGAIRYHDPPVANVYAANVTKLVTYTVYVVSGMNGTIFTATEKQTQQLGAGKNDMSTWYPAGMSPDYICFLNDTISTLTALYITAQDKTILADYQDTAMITAAQSAVAAPDTTFTYNDLVFAMDRKRFSLFMATMAGAAAVHDLLYLEYAGGDVVNPAPTAASTPTEPASNRTGAPIAGGSAVGPAGGVGLGKGTAYGMGSGGAGGLTKFVRRGPR